MPVKYSKEFLISEFNRFYNEFGRYPTSLDLRDKNNNYPSETSYKRHWGTYSNFLKERGFNDDGWCKEDEDVLITMYPTEDKEKIIDSLKKKRSWERVQQKAKLLGLKRSHVAIYGKEKITKEFLIEEFWRFYDENGRYPLGKDFKNNKHYPSFVSFTREWGSWNNVLKELGVLGENGWYKSDEQVLIDMYEDSERRDIINKLMIKRKWDAIKEKASKMGLKRDLSAIRRLYTDEYLINEIKRYYKIFTKIPTFNEMKENKDFPSPKVYQKRFGSWNKALELAGFELNMIKDHNKEDIIEDAMNFYKINKRSPYYNDLNYSRTLIHNYWNSWSEFLDECGLPQNKQYHNLKTKEDGIDFLINLNNKLNRLPTVTDISNMTNVNRDWFSSKFGSYENALLESGLITEDNIFTTEELISNSLNCIKELTAILERIPTVVEYENFLKHKKGCLSRRNLCNHLNMSFIKICEDYLELTRNFESGKYGHHCINKKGEICSSVAEMNISNIFIDNNITYLPQPHYNEIMDITERYRFDWKINHGDKIIYVEYFGLYSNVDSESEILSNYKSKTELKIYLCAKNNVNLLAIFPKDLKCGYKGFIEKFKLIGIDLTVSENYLLNVS